MLSLLSSWLQSDSDDPLRVECTDFVLERDSDEDEDSEWVWVVITPRDKEDVESVLEEYIVVPPCIPKNDPTTSKRLSYRSALRLDLHARRKKQYSSKLKVYPPLKIQPSECVVQLMTAFLRRSKFRPAPYECPRGDAVQAYQDLHWDGLPSPQNLPKIDYTNNPETSILSHPINTTRDPLGFIDINKSRTRTRPRVICDLFERLSADGWSVLVDPTGEFLTSSMVRLSSTRNSWLKDREQSRCLLESLASGPADPFGNVFQRGKRSNGALSGKPSPVDQASPTCSIKRRKQNMKHELTVKPGHTSLLVKKSSRDLTLVPWSAEIYGSSWYESFCSSDDVQLSRRLKSLVRSYKELFLKIHYYLAQLLDSLVSDDDQDTSCRGRKRRSDGKLFDKFSDQRRRQRERKRNGRKILGRWNTSRMTRRDKAVCVRRRAMGRGRLNCAVRRSF